MSDLPPKPNARADRVSLWQYLRLFRRDILSAQPARLYGAWMAEFRTPFFRSYLINDPALLRQVLRDRPDDFPKSDRIGAGLRPLLGNSVFLTNGAVWQAQRRIIDPAFEGGRLRDTFDGIIAAGQAGCLRLAGRADGTAQAIDSMASHIAADVIFRTLFSIPIEDRAAAAVYHHFQAYQQVQPLVNLAAFVPLPRWMPRLYPRGTKTHARAIRRLITDLTVARLAQIAAGDAPDDLATKIMTTPDPQTGRKFTTAEMVDQVAIFFLAGHETSASALGWALYLLATHPQWQDRAAAEAAQFSGQFSDLSKLPVIRDVFRETLRLYPPVPMMVRQAAAWQKARRSCCRHGICTATRDFGTIPMGLTPRAGRTPPARPRSAMPICRFRRGRACAAAQALP